MVALDPAVPLRRSALQQPLFGQSPQWAEQMGHSGPFGGHMDKSTGPAHGLRAYDMTAEGLRPVYAQRDSRVLGTTQCLRGTTQVTRGAAQGTGVTAQGTRGYYAGY
uniref:Uncharacterized protein n=1 Tax=Eutreptiella gymnastica TaxID=73025 RepID=A0A7S1IMR3_9EUGL|mmetsp:Transcript_30101/g.54154  ORF Transcript_30101/g.54154 Transcript_30101/m.54154 type:complete len:107 (+) Transcript_30101:161-481(+)